AAQSRFRRCPELRRQHQRVGLEQRDVSGDDGHRRKIATKTWFDRLTTGAPQAPALSLSKGAFVAREPNMRKRLMAVVGTALTLSVWLSAAPSSPVADAAQQGDRDAVKSLLKQAADVNAVEPVRGLNAAMFAAASNRAAAIEFLAKHGADLKATTKIVDLNNIDRNSYGGILFGNPAPPPAPGQTAAQAAAGLGQSQP